MQQTKRNEIIQAHLSAMVTQTDISGGICICVHPGAELVDLVGLCDQSDKAVAAMLNNLSETLHLLLRGDVIRADGTLNLMKLADVDMADALDDVDDNKADDAKPVLLH